MIKDVIAQIRAKLSDEELSKVSGLLSQVEREGDDLGSDLSAANHESKTRKEKIRELQSQIDGSGDLSEKHKAEVEKLKAEVKELKGYKTEIETFKAKELETFTTQFDGIVKQLTVEETDPKFKKYKLIKDKFKLAEEGKTLTADEIKANLEIYNLAKEFGGLEDDGSFEDGANPKGQPPKDTSGIFDAFPTN